MDYTDYYDYGYGFYPGEESKKEKKDSEDSNKSEEHKLPPIKELMKIELEENEALLVKLPEGTSAEEAEKWQLMLMQILNTPNIIVFIGDIKFEKVGFKQYQKHPLYE